MEIIGLIGGLIALIGLFWLVIIAFQEGSILWGILIVVFSWMGGLAFCIVNKKGWLQFALLMLGLILAVIGFSPAILKQLKFQ
jgi:hypothetical protein